MMDAARPAQGLRLLRWTAGSRVLMVPATAVLEVVRLPVAVAPIPATVPWRGHDLPVFAPADGEPPPGARLLICVGPLPSPAPGLVAILTMQQPQLITITAADLIATNGAGPCQPVQDLKAVLRSVCLKGTAAAVLDLGAIQQAVVSDSCRLHSSPRPVQSAQVP